MWCSTTVTSASAPHRTYRRGNTAAESASVCTRTTIGASRRTPSGTTTASGSGPNARFRWPNRSTGVESTEAKHAAPSPRSPIRPTVTPSAAASVEIEDSSSQPFRSTTVAAFESLAPGAMSGSTSGVWAARGWNLSRSRSPIREYLQTSSSVLGGATSPMPSTTSLRSPTSHAGPGSAADTEGLKAFGTGPRGGLGRLVVEHRCRFYGSGRTGITLSP
ncbi:MAG: hypothetical protein MAG471_00001 [Acidimicrobiaceae bacterium]|nr:hypothetical protein [Acidimicrobiaceae bacterium]